MTVGRDKDTDGRDATAKAAPRRTLARPAQTDGKAKRFGPFVAGKKLRAYDRPGRGAPVAVQSRSDAGDVLVMKHVDRVTRAAAPDLTRARQRLANLPTGFTDWVGSAPAWPADAPEIIGPRVVEAD